MMALNTVRIPQDRKGDPLGKEELSIFTFSLLIFDSKSCPSWQGFDWIGVSCCQTNNDNNSHSGCRIISEPGTTDF